MIWVLDNRKGNAPNWTGHRLYCFCGLLYFAVLYFQNPSKYSSASWALTTPCSRGPQKGVRPLSGCYAGGFTGLSLS